MDFLEDWSPPFWRMLGSELTDQLAAEQPKEKLPSTHERRIKRSCEAQAGEHEPIDAIEKCRLAGKRCQQIHCLGPIVILPTPANHHAFIKIEIARADLAHDRMFRTRVNQVNALPTLPQLVQ